MSNAAEGRDSSSQHAAEVPPPRNTAAEQPLGFENLGRKVLLLLFVLFFFCFFLLL